MKFKIYPFPGEKPWFYWVKVAAGRSGMYRMFDNDSVSTNRNKDQHILALCSSYKVWSIRKGKRKERAPELGTIYFYNASLTPEIVAHECMHATLGLMRATGLKKRLLNERGSKGMVGNIEELLCEVHGMLVKQIHDKTKVK